MKKIKLLLFTILCTGLLHAQQPLTASQQAVQQTVIKVFESLSNRDSLSLKDYCTTDITLYEYGQLWNMDTLILKGIIQNQAADFKRINTFHFISTHVDKSIAWVTYSLQSIITKDGKPGNFQWLETVALVKKKKNWKVKHLHSTLIKRS
ncbi:MAG: nuclear transport factor 2 family protein [Chitinophagaceae bacterium]|jgi:hypothetical protein|nr:nuclear transport factor 2 family protein [Chitinophagaceae bacterium]